MFVKGYFWELTVCIFPLFSEFAQIRVIIYYISLLISSVYYDIKVTKKWSDIFSLADLQRIAKEFS